MSDAMESIVNAYVRMNNRAVLEEMRIHRHRLKISLYLRDEERRYNVSPAVRSLQDDLSVIEAGIERLQDP
jgi:sulfur relay (sulfurtransferase) DsrC/TusE family protein